MEELEAGLAAVASAPADEGVVELIVARPDLAEREVLDDAELSVEVGLVGDNWQVRGSRHTPDGWRDVDWRWPAAPREGARTRRGGDRVL
jgi:hypothetical protein